MLRLWAIRLHVLTVLHLEHAILAEAHHQEAPLAEAIPQVEHLATEANSDADRLKKQMSFKNIDLEIRV